MELGRGSGRECERTGEEDPAAGTGEAIALVDVADVVDVGEGEVEDGDLDKAREQGGDDLG